MATLNYIKSDGTPVVTGATVEKASVALVEDSIPRRQSNGYVADIEGGFPDIQRKINITLVSQSNYITSPGTGWVSARCVTRPGGAMNITHITLQCAYKNGTNYTNYVTISESMVYTVDEYGIGCSLPVCKGDKVYVNYRRIRDLELWFVPCKAAL